LLSESDLNAKEEEMNKWITTALVAVLALSAMITACGTPAPATPPVETSAPEGAATVAAPPTATTPPVAPKVLRIATAAGCTAMSVEEGVASGPCGVQRREVYEDLTWVTPHGEIVPELATSWEMIDPTTWQFKLREGVKFHNGDDFNAEDVSFSIDVHLDPDRAWALQTTWALVEGAEVVDDYTVNISTSEPWPDLPFFAANLPIMPAAYTQEVGDEGLIANPVGSGPFKFVEIVPDDYLKLEAFDDYWGGRPKIDEILWRLIPEPATRVAALQAGEVDLIAQVPADLIELVEEDPSLHMQYADEQMSLLLWLDTFTGGPLDDIRVRQAVDYAIDKETIWRELMGGLGRLSDQMLTPGVFGYNPDIVPRPYDPDKAKELLDEAGYADGLSLQLQVQTGKYFVDRDAAIAIADQLSKAGIDVQVNVLEYAVHLDYILHPEKRADMIYVGIYSYGNPAQAMQYFSKDNALHRWENDEATQLFATAKSSLDEQERLDAWHRMAEIMQEEVPAVFLMQQPAPYGVSNVVVDWEPHPAQDIYLVDTDLER
jgi:peptide/nickel transport system substrate-binding protein